MSNQKSLHEDQALATGQQAETPESKENVSQDSVDWDLYIAKYGISGERIPMLRVLGWGSDCSVIEVTNCSEKKGKCCF